MLNSYDLRQLSCMEADILLQNIEVQQLPPELSAEIIMKNEQQLEIIAELRMAALN